MAADTVGSTSRDAPAELGTRLDTTGRPLGHRLDDGEAEALHEGT